MKFTLTIKWINGVWEATVAEYPGIVGYDKESALDSAVVAIDAAICFELDKGDHNEV